MPIKFSNMIIIEKFVEIIDNRYPGWEAKTTGPMRTYSLDKKVLFSILIPPESPTGDKKTDIFLKIDNGLNADTLYEIAFELDAKCHNTLNISILD